MFVLPQGYGLGVGSPSAVQKKDKKRGESSQRSKMRNNGKKAKRSETYFLKFQDSANKFALTAKLFNVWEKIFELTPTLTLALTLTLTRICEFVFVPTSLTKTDAAIHAPCEFAFFCMQETCDVFPAFFHSKLGACDGFQVRNKAKKSGKPETHRKKTVGKKAKKGENKQTFLRGATANQAETLLGPAYHEMGHILDQRRCTNRGSTSYTPCGFRDGLFSKMHFPVVLHQGQIM